MKCALYHRVSTLDQDPTLAREELYLAARARGYQVVLDIEETGSGARNDREGLQRVIEAAKRGKVSAVLVWKIDRFARSALDLLVNIKTLQDAGCRFVAVSQGIDLSPKGDPISQLLVTVLAGVAEFERSIIRERTRMGVEKARRAGKHLGRPRSADAPEPAKVIELREKGLSWSRISEELECTPSAARRAACRKGSASGDVVTH